MQSAQEVTKKSELQLSLEINRFQGFFFFIGKGGKFPIPFDTYRKYTKNPGRAKKKENTY